LTFAGELTQPRPLLNGSIIFLIFAGFFLFISEFKIQNFRKIHQAVPKIFLVAKTQPWDKPLCFCHNYNKKKKNNLVIIHEKKIWFCPTVAKTQPGKLPSKLTYVLLLSFAFYDLLLLFNILVFVENNIMSERPFYGEITESSRKGPKHEILNSRKRGYRTRFS
jgi:hypothetical protein